MDERLKKRLVGATVLVSLVVIFVPMLLEREPMIETDIHRTNIPELPVRTFSPNLVPRKGENLAQAPVLEQPAVVSLRSAVQPSKSVIVEVVRGASERKVTKAAVSATATPVVPRVGLTAWVVQVGSFSQQTNADKLIADLRRKEYPAFLEQTEINGKMHFRVKVGPEIDFKLAEKMLSSLNKDLKHLKLKGTLKIYP